MAVKVSVIIPNYNHEHYLHERLTSVLAQSFQNFELIILDDKSTDNSQMVIDHYQQHPKVSHIVVNEQNSGSTFKQWLKGVALCRGEYIWIAESDDVAHPHFLESLVSTLDKNTQCSLAYCQSNEINEHSQVIGDYFRYTEDLNSQLWRHDFTLSGNEFVIQYLSKRNCIPNASAILFRRQAFEQLDQAVCSCRYLGDWLFYIKVLKDQDIAFTQQKLNGFRTHQATTRSGKSIEQWRETKREFDLVYQNIYQNFQWPKTDYLSACKTTNDMVDKILDLVPTISTYCQLKKGVSIAIYGAGSLGVFAKSAIEQHFSSTELSINCFIDKKALNLSSQAYLNNTPVYSLPQFIDNINHFAEPLLIFIASIAFYHDIYQELVQQGCEHMIIQPMKKSNS